MQTILTETAADMGRYTGERAAEDLRSAIDRQGIAHLVVATGASQFEVLLHLTRAPGIDWDKVHGFHLDEYIGIDQGHKASFCKYLKERFVDNVPLASFHFLDGSGVPGEVVAEASKMISAVQIDLALVGIGENGHLAFNDPPADFETEVPYLIVDLDEECRQQQVGEGWFHSMETVPKQAISMSVRQILRSQKIYCSVPDRRKANAVRNTLLEPVSPAVPASILREHSDCTLVIDQAAACELPDDLRENLERFE